MDSPQAFQGNSSQVPAGVKAGRARVLLRLYYILPLALWMGAVLLSATSLAEWHTTWYLVQPLLNFLDPLHRPDTDPTGSGMVSLYQVNGALRNLSHVVAYAVLTLLAVRAVQQGQERLKRASLAVAVVLSLFFVVGDEFVRLHTPDRHAKLSDWLLNGMGIAAVLAWVVLRYATRAWVRKMIRQGDELEAV